MVRVCNCSQRTFKKLISTKDIVAVCAGEDFAKFCKEYDATGKIKYVIDNTTRGIIHIEGYSIESKAFGEISEIGWDDTIIVLTSLLYADELICQLDNISEIDGMEVYVPQLINMEVTNTELPVVDVETIIPKKIHYCWFGGNPIPDEFKKYISTWYEKCPDYEIICWNEENYDITKNKYMYEAYKAKKWGFVPDYARLDIIYEQGGFYLDTDVELLQSLDSLRNYEFVCGFESYKHVALGLGFGAIAKNEDILKMREMYEKIHFVLDDGTLNLIASPVYQTEYFLKQGLIQNGKLQVINKGIVLPTEFLCPIDALGKGELTSTSVSVHHYAGTWLEDKEQKKKIRKKNNREMLLCRALQKVTDIPE